MSLRELPARCSTRSERKPRTRNQCRFNITSSDALLSQVAHDIKGQPRYRGEQAIGLRARASRNTGLSFLPAHFLGSDRMSFVLKVVYHAERKTFHLQFWDGTSLTEDVSPNVRFFIRRFFSCSFGMGPQGVQSICLPSCPPKLSQVTSCTSGKHNRMLIPSCSPKSSHMLHKWNTPPNSDSRLPSKAVAQMH